MVNTTLAFSFKKILLSRKLKRDLTISIAHQTFNEIESYQTGDGYLKKITVRICGIKPPEIYSYPYKISPKCGHHNLPPFLIA